MLLINFVDVEDLNDLVDISDWNFWGVGFCWKENFGLWLVFVYMFFW